MTLSQTECFIEVVKAGSFSKAAANLFMTQQGVSNQIKALETELGFPVFKRLNRGVELTDEGKILFEYWEDAYNRLKIGIDKAKDEHSSSGRVVNIGMQDMGNCSEDIMSGFMEYGTMFPELTINFEVLSPREILEQLESGKLDMAVLYSSEFSAVKGINCLELHDKDLKVSVFYSKKNALAGKKKLKLKDFMGQPLGCLAPEISLDFKKKHLNLFSHLGLDFKGELQEYGSRRDLELGLIADRCFTVVYETMFIDSNKNLLSFELKDDEIFGSAKISLFWKNPKTEIKARTISNILREKLSRLS